MDWDIFRCCSENIDEFTETVVRYIGKLVDDTVPRITIRTYPNQKPWLNHSIRDALNKHTAAYKLLTYIWGYGGVKATSYSLQQMVKKAKRRYGENIQSQHEQSDFSRMWQGLREMSDCKVPMSSIMCTDTSQASTT